MKKIDAKTEYLKQVKSRLSGTRAGRKAAVQQARQMLMELPNIENLSEEALFERVGTPEAFVELCVPTRARRSVLLLIAALMVLLLLGSLWLFRQPEKEGLSVTTYKAGDVLPPDAQAALEKAMQMQREKAPRR